MPNPEIDFSAEFGPLTSSLSSRWDSDRPAFTFVDYGEHRDGVETTLSWAELDRRARAVAARLAQITGPGERVAVLCPQNLDYVVGFFGALYAGVIAVPLFAPEVSSHGERLVGALADCDPEVWLTSESAMADIRGLMNNHPVPRPKHLVAVDTVDSELAADYRPVPVSPEQPAYLQYTSGSTRTPAGAVITHRALAVNVRQVVEGFGIDQDSTCVGWLPFFHDMRLVQLVCLPVYAGCHSVFTTPFAFTRRPVRWLRMLGAHPDVITAAPNFAYEYAAAKLSKEDSGAPIDLSGVRVAINGSEPVRAETIAGFLAATGPLGFRADAHRPSYGLAEATVFVSTTPPRPPRVVTLDRAELSAGRAIEVATGDDRALTLVSAGVPVGQQLRIVDGDRGVAMADGDVGEIWLHGANVADGYWRQPERSAETFGGRLGGGSPEGGWLRTGDLGVRHDGELFITGRLKDLIIIDGKNHYPQDIEATVQESHPALRRDRLAVFSVTREGREAPVVVAEYSSHVDAADREPSEVERAVRVVVSRHHDLRLADFVLARPGTVLRTSSGKIARAATRALYLSGELS
ncbi:fatty acyl-AMP ligase [Amycolatopsis sp. H20-H5]|uniref:fatty acyl-AMP ligase n=1 Tax=Amycolatopsis sp. H20-H5 TaxID=3046309 RepID=UPI002DBE1FED|nr:fatty acyl-AMP ligase [Amycolatopsis sp. H20-H5]MEC3976431.1 fatty acyl-AMP ligase [Amycolatopsis sp. H20-H5]